MTVGDQQRTRSEKASTSTARLLLLRGVLGPFLALGLVVAFFGIADRFQADGGAFLSQRNVRALTVQTATVAVAALGMTVVIIAGGIDLSAGTALSLCACVLAWSLKSDIANPDLFKRNMAELVGRNDASQSEPESGESRAGNVPETTMSKWTPPLAIGLCLLAGCTCGLINGALISYLRVVPFIVTLGTMTVFLGVAKWLSDNTTIRPDKATQVPSWLANFCSIRTEALWSVFPAAVWLSLLFAVVLLLVLRYTVFRRYVWSGFPAGVWLALLLVAVLSLVLRYTIFRHYVWSGLPVGVWLALLLAAVLSLVLRYTVFSRYVFALGSNELTARLCGISVQKNKIAVYALAGLFIGIAGIYQFARLSVGNATSGVGLELNIIAAVVIGGGSLSGGRGSVLGTLTGAAIMAVITSGCTQLGLDNAVQDMVLGIIIIAAVTLDQFRQRRLAN